MKTPPCPKTLLAALGLLCAAAAHSLAGPTLPNIVIIYADDLGYGDAGAYGAKRIPTPNIDRLAREGLRFTNGYAPSATCTPSRYAMLTGEYAWRQKGVRILPGDAALLIAPGRPTLASILKNAGYHTGIIGKWHLGLGNGQTDWNGEIKPGPLEVGFDESFIIAATLDRVPCVFVRNHRVENLDPADPLFVSYDTPFPGEPTGKLNPEMLKLHPGDNQHDKAIVNGISRIGYFKGGKSALWKDEEMADTFANEAVKFLEQNQSKPFFLYFALPDPHVPRAPAPRFVGKTDMGPRGDAIVQADWSTGKILETLDRLKLSENTLVILSSDNGPVLDDGYQDDAVEKLGDHTPAGPLRGGKYSIYDAGTRVPFIVRWNSHIKPGVSDALVNQVDFPASLAALVQQPFSALTAPDSQNVLSALLGQSQTGRDHLVEHNGAGGIALRAGSWKFIPGYEGDAKGKKKAAGPQLYDLSSDLAEKHNLIQDNPEKAKALQAQLDAIKQQGGFQN